MKWYYVVGLLIICLIVVFYFTDSQVITSDIIRPEKIVSKREIVYDTETYKKLAELWERYYDVYPSEDAYANWMYATRYTGYESYFELLDKGLKRYPANPVLLYLAGMKKHGASDNDLGRARLEKAVAIDPTFIDPWFALVINYMSQGDEERTVLALRNILDGGAMAEELMDLSFNILKILDKDAILITNGDNDTYPGWILTRVLNIRPDVMIVNRSLLNTDWYPKYLIERGLPGFITEKQLEELRSSIFKYYQEQSLKKPVFNPYADTLISRLVDSSLEEARAVYFSSTLFESDIINRYCENGRFLGLVTLVTPPVRSYTDDLRKLFSSWLNDFRTGGLDSWSLAHSKEAYAGRKIIMNYAAGIWQMRDSIRDHVPELRQELLNWIHLHVERSLHPDWRNEIKNMWKPLTPTVDNHNRCPIHGSHK